jgi:recombinational DNA repair protein (RecF pathway)
MIWDDTGFLLSKNRYNENSLIAEVLQKIMENFWYNFWWNFKKN